MRRQSWKHASRGAVVGFACLALLMATASCLSGQEKTAANSSQPADSSPPVQRDYRFEVASIRPSGPPTGYPNMAALRAAHSFSSGLVREEQVSLANLVGEAFGVKQGYEMEAPSWMGNEHFTVNATPPEGATKADLPIMIRHLLEDRFGLKYHHETRQISGYELVVAKSGLKIAKSSGPEPDPTAVKGTGVSFKDGLPQFDKHLGNMNMCAMDYCALHGRNRGMQALAADLTGRLRAPVTDATGLEGGYDYTVIFTDEFVMTLSGVLAPVTDMPDAPLAHPLLHEALKEQLGLEVRPVKNVPVDVVVIDSGSKVPTEN